MMHTLPLLRDSHTHPMLYAAFMSAVDLSAAATRAAALAQLRAATDGNPHALTLAYGWNSGRLPLAPSDFVGWPPVVILNVSLHGLLANEAALAIMHAHDPLVVAHLDDDDWRERNLRRVLNVLATSGASVARLQQFFAWLRHEHGIIYAEEMLLVNADEIALIREAGLRDRTRFWAAPDTYEELPAALRAEVHGVKLFTDGALGVRTAALHDNYRDAPQRGLLLYDDGELRELLTHYVGRAVPLAIHAIGDRAIDQVVTLVAHVQPPRGAVRIEHAQLISAATAQLAKALGIVLCMQPNFSADSVCYADRLPGQYAAQNNPFRQLIDEVGYVPGVDLFFGSDGMPHGPRDGLRQALFPSEAGQRLTLAEFVAGYTAGASTQGALTVTIADAARTVHVEVG